MCLIYTAGTANHAVNVKVLIKQTSLGTEADVVTKAIDRVDRLCISDNFGITCCVQTWIMRDRAEGDLTIFELLFHIGKQNISRVMFDFMDEIVKFILWQIANFELKLALPGHDI